MYKPNLIFSWLAAVFAVIGLVPFIRFIVLSIEEGSASGHIQSLLLGSLFLIAAFLSLALNIIADLIRINRILTEDNLEQTKRQRFQQN